MHFLNINMDDQDRYIFWDIAATFVLLESIIFLFSGVFAAFSVYLALGLMSGLALSWFTRNNPIPALRIAIDIGMSVVFIWLIFALANSSFLYQDVIALLIRAGIFIELILSLDSASRNNRSYMQALTLPLFMCFPFFVRSLDPAYFLILFYLAAWAVILKLKFYKFVGSGSQELPKRYASGFLSVFFIAAALLVSWVLFSAFPLKEMKEGGVFLYQEDRNKEEALEREYYVLQDDLRNELEKVLPELNSDERQRIVLMFSQLVKESSQIMEVEEARQGLLDPLKRAGPGMEASLGRDITFLMQEYLQKKTRVDLKRTKDGIRDTLKQGKANLKDRMTVLSKVNQMQYDQTYNEVEKHRGELEQGVSKTTLPIDTKKELKRLSGQFAELRLSEIYNQKKSALEKKINSLEAKSKAQDLSAQIDHAGSLSEARQAQKRVKDLERGRAFPDGLLQDFKEFLGLRLEMLLSGENRKLKEKIDESEILPEESGTLKDNAEMMHGAKESRAFLESLSRFQDKAQEYKADNLGAQLKNYVDMKTHIMANRSMERMQQTLKKESVLTDSGAGFLSEIERLETERNSQRVISETRRLLDTTEKLFNSGLIAPEAKDRILKELSEIQDILMARFDSGKSVKRDRSAPDKSSGQATYDEQALEDLLDKADLKEEKKEALKQYGRDLMKAQNISRVQDIADTLQKEMNTLSREGISRETLEKIKKAFKDTVNLKKLFVLDKELSALRKDMDKLQKSDPEQAKIMKGYLDKVRMSSTGEELERNMQELKDFLSEQEGKRRAYDEQAVDNESSKRGELLEISVIPARLILPVGGSFSLKCLGIYEKKFIKEISADIDWSSSSEDVYIDERGAVSAMAKGDSLITARYKGAVSNPVKITVVDKIDAR